jgi:WS/DGAT/MGAT family acyltransferase
MARYAYERLSAQDASFLLAEGPTTPMHVSAIQIYEAGPLREDGGIAIDKVRAAYESVLHLVPRYRQKLAWVPIESRPVWVDDPYFQLDYHIRHVALPHPGSLEELKRVAARVMAHALDRNRPLWELWVVEGLQGDRFATISKVHHCMVDGSSGVELAQRLLQPTPHAEVETPPPYYPRPIPSGTELLRDEVLRRVTMPIRAVRSLRAFRDEAEDVRAEVGVRLKALADLVGIAVSGVSETPMNGELSPHRRFDWYDMSLADVKAVRKQLDCTVNDVVLGIVTEAVRRFLVSRNVDPAGIRFRAATPVSVRGEDERQKLGNRVSSWMVELPVGEPDRLKQITILREATQELKASRQALGVDMIMAAAEAAPIGIFSFGAQLAAGPVNTIVTNVPGPQFPLYMLGAKMIAMIPEVPLLEGIGLGIALMSYNGRIFWGFTGDYEMMPDLSRFVRNIGSAFAELAAAAGVDLASPDDRPPSQAAASLPEGARPILTAIAGERREPVAQPR